MKLTNRNGTQVRAILKKNLEENISIKAKNIFKCRKVSPVIKAPTVWAILSEQLETILGPEIHRQWFLDVKPLIITDNILILQTKDNFAAQWINEHYQDLVNTLVKTQDKRISCFFIYPK